MYVSMYVTFFSSSSTKDASTVNTISNHCLLPVAVDVVSTVVYLCVLIV